MTAAARHKEMKERATVVATTTFGTSRVEWGWLVMAIALDGDDGTGCAANDAEGVASQTAERLRQGSAHHEDAGGEAERLAQMQNIRLLSLRIGGAQTGYSSITTAGARWRHLPVADR